MLALPKRPAALFLDFDGVIVESVRLKIDAFLRIYAGEHPEKLAAILEHQRTHGGVTRRLKFRHFERHVFGREVDDDRIEQLSREYTRLVHDAVLACPFVAGAPEFLDRMHGHANLHVISGTPLDELSDIARRRNLAGYFASLHGAPETKPEAFARILSAFDYQPREVLAVGDATTECDAAAALGIPFLAVVPVGEPNPFPPGLPTVPTLEGLAERLGFAR
jgi:phosphoglycolate phosphatase